MATNQPPADENPIIIGVEPVYFFNGVAAVPPAGTFPPPRPKGMERTPLPPGTVRGWEYIELDGTAVPAPPGTMPPPRPPGYPQRVLRPPQHQPVSQPEPQSQPEVAALVARIESALETIHTALAEIKRLQTPPQSPPQSKAG